MNPRPVTFTLTAERVEILRRTLIPLSLVMLVVSFILLIGSTVLWVFATMTGLINSVAFISHISMAALLFGALGGLAGAIGSLAAIVPTDDLVESEEEEA